MKNRGSTPILTNLVHPRNIHTKFEANPCSGLGEEVENVKSLRPRLPPRQRRRRRTQPDPLSHTHSLSVTNKSLIFQLSCDVNTMFMHKLFVEK